jgi:hypothetical protein
MASDAAFHPIRRMLEYERTLLIGVTLEARLLLEAAQPGACADAVLLVTVRALDHSLENAMTLVQMRHRSDLLVARQAGFVPRLRGQCARPGILHRYDEGVPAGSFVWRMTIRARDGSSDVVGGAEVESVLTPVVTVETRIDLLFDRVQSAGSEDQGCLAKGLGVLGSRAVAAFTTGDVPIAALR